MATYIYSVIQDTPNQKVDVGRLELELRTSAITIALNQVSIAGDVITVDFKASLPPADKILLDNNAVPAGGLIGAHSGEPLPIGPDLVSLANPTTTDNRLKVAVEKSDGSRATFVTHDWTDRTTWYSGSVRVEDQALAVITSASVAPVSPTSGETYYITGVPLDAWTGQSGKLTTWNGSSWEFFDLPQGWTFEDDKAYKAPHSPLIDLNHGKIWNEEKMRDGLGNLYKISVEVENSPVLELDTFDSSGDYFVDYDRGIFFFVGANNANDNVTATYYYPTHSHFVIKPNTGNKVSIESVDVQFSEDVNLTDTIVFEVYGLVDVFAPQLVQANILPSGTLIPIDTTYYKTMKDYQAECDRSYPPYPAMGGSSWRGIQHATQVFHWEYVRGVTFYSSMGMELHIYLQHNFPYGGEYATATFYCVEDPEVLS